ncbi:ATP-dependent DNA helicase RecQ [Desulfovibrio sp. X2]|uniref:DNA helicase RecQ n=1 Tax=Desulfovibrio sp. X2 TaxID=941449 RepID=UPI000358F121|nr:DNA helicase RecQ [Desulfovibrio sp. X2]EPR38683.1 ATP-dependent DNA helicase RecQ [Desulfovibrio sp. X2]
MNEEPSDSMHSRPLPSEILRDVFGHAAFRGCQEAVIGRVVSGGDALVVMPTGGGKSVCYQVPALAMPGTAVVVSPLVALMQDQVAGLLQAGVRAASINSALDAAERGRAERALRAGELDIVYVAPERLLQPSFLEGLTRLRICLFAIDEAHCVSQWGHDFRPEYRQLAVLAERFPDVPRLALTATAAAQTREDIVRQLRLRDPEIFVTGFDRPNIRYRVVPKDHAERQLLDFIRTEHAGDAGIVYRMTRRDVERTAAFLSERGMEALPYHAGLPDEERRQNMERFMREDGLVMVATVAFGMGVDKPDVRFVVHLEPPKSLEAYHQETGRAGRDGLPADAFMTYGLGDVIKLRSVLGVGTGVEEHKRIELDKLQALLGFCETAGCRRQALLGHFGERLAEPCGNCDTCLEPVETFEGSVIAQKALSCVFRTDQRFGTAHLAAVLTGRRTAAIERLGHDAVSTFGIGTELDDSGWRSVFRQLVAQGLADVDLAMHGAVRLNAASWEVLRGTRAVALRRDPERVKRKGPRGGRGRKAAWLDSLLDTPERAALFERLRGWRTAQAKEQDVPPYVICLDRTLLEIAVRQPDGLAELAATSGLGSKRVERYGDELLEILRAFYEEHGRTPGRLADETGGPGSGAAGREPRPARRRKRRGADGPSPTVLESLRLVRETGSMEETAQLRGLGLVSVQRHLVEAVRLGLCELSEVAPLPADAPERILSAAREVFLREGRRLRPLSEALGGEFDYWIIEAVLAAEERDGEGAEGLAGRENGGPVDDGDADL